MRIDLSKDWTICQAERNIRLKSNLPQDIYNLLLENQQIPDPFVEKNETEVQWAAYLPWTWEKEFFIEENPAVPVFLNISNLDTVCEIKINNQLCAETDNMFQKQRIDVSRFLIPGKNTLTILFKAAAEEALKRAARHPYPVPSTTNNRVPHMNFLRKVQCHAGWDWGPVLITHGIYGNIYLSSYPEVELLELNYDCQIKEDHCLIHFRLYAHTEEKCTKQASIWLDDKEYKQNLDFNKENSRVDFSIKLEKYKLWQPRGYGEAHLYQGKLVLEDQSLDFKLGIREIKIKLDEDADNKGSAFIVNVNGQDIFLKGANWIPQSPFPGSFSREKYTSLLETACQANINCIRVWGGGLYEKEDFYNLCDSLGLLVWQDFMFSCALYPANPEFLKSVRKEAEYQVKRLQPHPCLALWCGDNEVIGALSWYEESQKDRDRYLVHYDRLNSGVLKKTVEELDPLRLFWPSSPAAGKDNYLNNFQDNSRGDMHYWEVWHGRKPFEAYYSIQPRLCSEFGYQSFPSLSSINYFCPDPAQQNISSPVMEFHQRSEVGNDNMAANIFRYFRFPEGFDNFIYQSQIQQGIGLDLGVRYWRSLRPYCMGTIYWQLHDMWPVASWSSIEYNGDWKLSHYFVREFYREIIASVIQKDENLARIFLISDRPEKTEVKINLSYYDFQGQLLKEDIGQLKIEDQSLLIRELQTKQLPLPQDQCFLEITLQWQKQSSSYTHFFTPWKNCALPRPQIQSRINWQKDKAHITLQTDKPSFFTALEIPGKAAIFERNVLTLLPGQDYQITAWPRDCSFNKNDSLKIRHLQSASSSRIAK